MTHADPTGPAHPPGPHDRHGDSTYAHLAPLFKELADLPPDSVRHAEIRAELIEGYLPVAKHIARRFGGRGEPEDDLVQAGTIGLIGAVDRFDPGRGLDFLSFAVPTITGEIRRHFRDRTWSMRVPRRLKDIQAAMSTAIGPLSQELGRAPRPTEIAERLGVPVEDILDGLIAQQAYRTDSLDQTLCDGGAPLAERLSADDHALEKIDYRESLAPLIAQLPDRERTILILRFFGNRTQSQIGEVIGISQMHVSRLLDRTLKQLRERLTAETLTADQTCQAIHQDRSPRSGSRPSTAPPPPAARSGRRVCSRPGPTEQHRPGPVDDRGDRYRHNRAEHRANGQRHPDGQRM